MVTSTPLKKEDDSIAEAETVAKSNVDWQYMTPGEKHAHNRREAEKTVQFMPGSRAFEPQHKSPSLFCEDASDDDAATYNSHVDDGFEDTQENSFSQEYYKI